MSLDVTVHTMGSANALAGATAAPQSTEGQGASLGAPLLPAPTASAAFVGDVGSEIAMLALDSEQSQRREATETRTLEEKAQDQADAAQVSALRDKASQAFSAGLVSGISTGVSGLITVGSALNDGLGPKTGGGESPVGKGLGGTAKVVEASGKLGATGFQKGADEADVNATAAAQSSARHRRAGDQANEDVDAADKDVDRALDFYKEWVAAKGQEAQASILRA